MNDTLYSDKFQEISEIYNLDKNEVTSTESEASYLQGQGWSQVSSVQVDSQSNKTHTQESDDGKTDEVAAAESPNEDLRPHYFDPVLKTFLLIDSGSQVTAIPPDPGDIEDKSVRLRAVNGTVIKTYGYKEETVSYKIIKNQK